MKKAQVQKGAANCNELLSTDVLPPKARLSASWAARLAKFDSRVLNAEKPLLLAEQRFFANIAF